MRYYLLPEDGGRYKANLHCHTTLSDGRLSPEQIKQAYMKEGYSVVAFSDHDRYHDQSALCSADFIAINAFEADVSDWAVESSEYRRCYHFNAFHSRQDKAVALPEVPEYGDIEGINAYIRELKELGFIVCYNHPCWSVQNLDDYRELKGCFAYEIYNYSSDIDGTDAFSPEVYNQLLRLGNKMFCVMTDDNHDCSPIGTPLNDSFGGYTVLFAPKLTYNDVFTSLKNGLFYCSQGPEIKSLYIEDGKLCVDCSEAQNIRFRAMGRRSALVKPEKGEYLTHAEYEIKSTDVLVRAEVEGPTGLKANTNAYFLDDLVRLGAISGS